MCAAMRAGRASGRRRNLVLVAEGARDLDGNPITVGEVAEVLERELGEDARVTILGHVQRGGRAQRVRPLPGHAARARRRRTAAGRPRRRASAAGRPARQRGGQLAADGVRRATRAVADRIAARDLEGAMLLRGGSFQEFHSILSTIQRAAPRPTRGRAAAVPDRRRARRRPRPRHEHRAPGGGAPGAGPRLQRAGGAQRLPRAARRVHPGDGLDGCQRPGLDRRRRARHQPLGARRDRPRADRRAPRRASHRRAADGGRVERVRRGARAALRPPPVPGAGPADRLPADDDQQRPAGDGADHRQRYRAEQHHRRRRQDQAVGGGHAAVLRRRGDGPRLAATSR